MKKKILMISDNLLSSSGVACQSRYLAIGLTNLGKYTVRQLGAAIKHDNHDVVAVTPDVVVKPIDGFGTKELYRQVLATERPDLTLIFTDPRFYSELFAVHDEFQQICPIVYWHLWDNCVYPPTYNRNIYDSVDAFVCINRPTYDFVRSLYPEDPERVVWGPHALPKEIFYPLGEAEQRSRRAKVLPGREDHFVVGWVGRNAHRKRPADVMWGFSKFVERMKREHGHAKATLLMHTDPHDNEGPNLLHVLDLFKLNDNVVFSKDVVNFDDMRGYYGVVDCTTNISYAEGFGLPILESMYCGKPVIAVKTGGLERQVVDHRDGSENGIALDVRLQKMVGSQSTPFILEDMCSVDDFADALWRMYEMGPNKRKDLGLKAMKYAHEEFSLDKLIATWDATIEQTLTTWRERRPRWTKRKI